MSSRVRSVAWMLCGVMLVAVPGVLMAANPPALTNYQGVLRGPAGEPLTGTYDMEFRFFDSESAGNEILIDRHIPQGGLEVQPVTVDGGLFSVELGGGAISDGSGPGIFVSLAEVFRDHSEVWLEVTIGAETLSPRTRVLATGYALNATNATTALTAATATTAMSATTAATATNATNATQLNSQPATFYLDTSATRQVKNGAVRFTTGDSSAYVLEAITTPGSPGAFWAQGANAGCVLATATNGAQCGGNSYGGYFYDANDSSFAYGGYGPYGLYSGGPGYGLYSTAWNSGATGVFSSAPQYGIYTTGTGTSGIGLYASGPTAAHFFQSNLSGSYAKAMWSGYGYYTQSYNGIHAWDYDDGGYSRIGDNPYKIHGNGAVSFSQNHPDDPDKVIMYHAPESSEVNVYTRGSARLTNGTASVALDPTFAWTANPDLGLTAHLTPRGEAVPLAVTSVSAREIVVRGPAGSNVTFDYWVTGLRIGFEEMPPVTRKKIPSEIPSKASGADIYAADPELRTFNALERHRTMEREVGRNVDPDMKATASLRGRIGVGRRMMVPDDARIAGESRVADPDIVPPMAVMPAGAPGSPEAERVPGLPQTAPDREAPRPQPAADGRPSEAGNPFDLRRPGSERFQATTPIEPGDVVVIDSATRGSVRRSDRQGDGTVVGIALSPVAGGWIEVAVGAVAEVRVDAGYGAVRAGDLLVSSPAPGAAMRAAEAQPGTILGKALEPLESGLGTIRVLVMLR